MLSWPRCQSLDVAIAIKSFIRDQIRTLVVMILPQKERGHYWFVLFSILAINVQRCGQCMHTVHHFMLSDTPPHPLNQLAAAHSHRHGLVVP